MGGLVIFLFQRFAFFCDLDPGFFVNVFLLLFLLRRHYRALFLSTQTHGSSSTWRKRSPPTRRRTPCARRTSWSRSPWAPPRSSRRSPARGRPTRKKQRGGTTGPGRQRGRRRAKTSCSLFSFVSELFVFCCRREKERKETCVRGGGEDKREG